MNFPARFWLPLFGAALFLLLLLLTGFRPGALPFIPGARFSDAAVSHYPAALFLHQSAAQGELPLWRETIMGGQPFMANPLNKTAYPPQWFAALLPPEFHLNGMIVAHLLIALWGMWRWSRALHLSEAAAGLSALAYALSPRVIGHTGAGHLDLLYALAWFPWLMVAVRRYFDPSPLKTESAVGRGLSVALVAALVFLADTRLSLFAFALAGMYGVWLLAQNRLPAQRLTGLLPFALVAALLTLSVIVPLLLWRPYLNRAALTSAEAGVFSLEMGHLLGLLLPAQRANVETLTYLGLPVLLLALFALVGQPRKHLFWLIALVVAILYGLGINGFLWSTLVDIVPGLLWFRVPSRAWFVVALIVPFLAGCGLDLLVSRSVRLARPFGLVALAVLLAFGVFALVALPLPDEVGLITLVIGSGASLLIMLSGRLRSQGLIALFLVLAASDLLLMARHWLYWREDWMSQRALAETLVELDAARVYSPTYSLEQQTAAAYDLRLFGGVDPFQLTGMVEAIQMAGGVESGGYSVVQPPLLGVTGDDLSSANRDARPDPALLAAWEVSHVVAAYPLNVDGLRLIDTVDGVYLYTNEAYPPVEQAQIAQPDATTIQQLNRWTVIAAGVSAVSFVVSITILIFLNARTQGRKGF